MTTQFVDPVPEIDRQSDGNANKQPRSSQTKRLVGLIEKHGVELVSSTGHAYAVVPIDEQRRATYAIRSRGMKAWLSTKYLEETSDGVRRQSLNDALDTVEAKALYGKEKREVTVSLRIAGDENTVDLDLGGDGWNMVRITRDGWRIITHTEGGRFFRRALGMDRLPLPVAGGKLNLLRRYINLADEEWSLLASWLIASAWPDGPYPVLALLGEQGSAKSTTAKILRSLIDPSVAPLSGMPRELRDMLIAASASWIVAHDNISRLNADFSDALCCISTGTGYRARTLYSDVDETILAICRPAILTGIGNFVTRGDLADRAVTLYLKAIPEDKRRDERSMWATFEQDRPVIVGALCDAISLVLQRLDEVRLTAKYRPRMADYALLAQAAEPAFGVESGTWERAHKTMLGDAHAAQLEHPIAMTLLALLNDRADWNGTATELLNALTNIANDATKRSNEWPNNARALSGMLRRFAPAFRANGIEFEPDKKRNDRNRTRIICISANASKSGQTPSVASVTSDDAQDADANRQNTDAKESSSSAFASTFRAETDDADGTDAKLRVLDVRDESEEWREIL